MMMCMHVEMLIGKLMGGKQYTEQTINIKKMYEGYFTFLFAYCRFLKFTWCGFLAKVNNEQHCMRLPCKWGDKCLVVKRKLQTVVSRGAVRSTASSYAAMHMIWWLVPAPCSS